MSLPDARKLNNKISSENHKVFQILLKKCSEQIRFNNKLKKTDLIFIVPHFLPDLSDYNTKDCINYIRGKLEQSHYTVEIKGNIMHISWKCTKETVRKIPEPSNEFDTFSQLKRKFPKAKLEYIINE
jgi:hypothetical protein